MTRSVSWDGRTLHFFYLNGALQAEKSAAGHTEPSESEIFHVQASHFVSDICGLHPPDLCPTVPKIHANHADGLRGLTSEVESQEGCHSSRQVENSSSVWHCIACRFSASA
eukprot:2651480-Amphidinium_carterae.1